MRNDFRSAMLSYIFDYTPELSGDEDMTFDGFKSQSMSMLDELDAFQLG